MHSAVIALAVLAVIAALVYMARDRRRGQSAMMVGDDTFAQMPMTMDSCMFRSRADCQKVERAHYKCKEYIDGCWYLVSVG